MNFTLGYSFAYLMSCKSLCCFRWILESIWCWMYSANIMSLWGFPSEKRITGRILGVYLIRCMNTALRVTEQCLAKATDGAEEKKAWSVNLNAIKTKREGGLKSRQGTSLRLHSKLTENTARSSLINASFVARSRCTLMSHTVAMQFQWYWLDWCDGGCSILPFACKIQVYMQV